MTDDSCSFCGHGTKRTFNCLAGGNAKIAYVGPEGERAIPTKQVYYTPEMVAALKEVDKYIGLNEISENLLNTDIHALLQKLED